MITLGTISLVVYLIAISLHWILKAFNKRVIFFSFIIVLCFAGFIAVGPRVFADNLSDLYQTRSIKRFHQVSTVDTCNAFATTRDPQQPTVILRLDDVQAFYLSDITQRILTDTLKRNMTLVAGAIPENLENDQKLVRAVRDKSCAIEIAQHGYNHSENEFKDLSYDLAMKKIAKGNLVIENLFSLKATTFIPPYNEYSAETGEALNDVGFEHVSSRGNWRFDHAAKTATWQGVITPLSEIITACEQKFIEHEPCVIMIHPQDYATNDILDETRYQNYTDLLDYIEENDIQTSTIKDY